MARWYFISITRYAAVLRFAFFPAAAARLTVAGGREKWMFAAETPEIESCESEFFNCHFIYLNVRASEETLQGRQAAC
jgi:hypothetical protein